MSRDPDWFTPQELGTLAGGFTAQFIRDEIRAGEIEAEYCCSTRRQLGRYRIRRKDGLAYIRKLRERQQRKQRQQA